MSEAIGRTRPTLDKFKTKPDYQFGFCLHHSATHHSHRFTNNITQLQEHREYCCFAFLDVQAAFDEVWIDGLLYKLRRFLPECLYKLMMTNLNNRYLHVRVGYATSGFKIIIRAGVPLGSVLGPTLYAV